MIDDVGYKRDVTLELEYRDITFDAIEEEVDFGLGHLKDCGWEIPDGVKIIDPL